MHVHLHRYRRYGLGWNGENISAYVTVYGHDGSVVLTHAV